MKFWQCILNLIWHHLSKFVVTIDKMTSLKNDVLSRWFMNLFFPQTLQLNLAIKNSKFGGAFLSPASGVDFADQVQNKA